MERRTLEIVRAGDQLSFKMSRQIPPCAFTLLDYRREEKQKEREKSTDKSARLHREHENAPSCRICIGPVVYFRDESDLRRFERIIGRELNFEIENAIRIRSGGGTDDRRHPANGNETKKKKEKGR